MTNYKHEEMPYSSSYIFCVQQNYNEQNYKNEVKSI